MPVVGSTYHSKSHDPKSHLGYTRFEILFILSSLVNTAVLISFAGDSARLLRWSAAVWATLFTLIVIKFHFEKDMIAKGKFDGRSSITTCHTTESRPSTPSSLRWSGTAC